MSRYGWADKAIESLQGGFYAFVQPHGNSMTGLVESGECVRLVPVTRTTEIRKGDVVLCRVRGRVYLHKVYAVDESTGRVQIGNNHGHVNGWTSRDRVYGVKIGS